MKPTRQDVIDDLQNRIWKGRIQTLDELTEVCEEQNLEPYDDILSPMEWNTCDLCGALSPSDEMCWTDCLDPDEDKDLIEYINSREEELCALCWECVKKLKKKAQEINKKGENYGTKR